MIKSLLCEILVLELINVKIERKLYSSWNKAFLFPLGIIADGMRDRKRYFKVKKERPIPLSSCHFHFKRLF